MRDSTEDCNEVKYRLKNVPSCAGFNWGQGNDGLPLLTYAKCCKTNNRLSCFSRDCHMQQQVPE